ncbi:hypothetical protein KDM41_16295 [bacterium]|nr:hypothetical protein [bacterium]
MAADVFLSPVPAGDGLTPPDLRPGLAALADAVGLADLEAGPLPAGRIAAAVVRLYRATGAVVLVTVGALVPWRLGHLAAHLAERVGWPAPVAWGWGVGVAALVLAGFRLRARVVRLARGAVGAERPAAEGGTTGGDGV